MGKPFQELDGKNKDVFLRSFFCYASDQKLRENEHSYKRLATAVGFAFNHTKKFTTKTEVKENGGWGSKNQEINMERKK